MRLNIKVLFQSGPSAATTFRLQSLSLSVHTRIHVIYALYRGEAMHVHAYTEIRTRKEREREREREQVKREE